jgi:predicted naringenin-chalcone synthase
VTALDRMYVRGLVTTPALGVHPQSALAAMLAGKLEVLPDGPTLARTVTYLARQSGIRERYVEIDLDAIDERVDWYRVVNEAAFGMAQRSLRRLFHETVPASACDALIVATTSYAGFPSLSRVLQERVGLPLTAPAYDLTGLGCASPTQALKLAAMLLRDGCSNVCLLCVDAMGTHGQARRFPAPPTDGAARRAHARVRRRSVPRHRPRARAAAPAVVPRRLARLEALASFPRPE